MVPGAGRWEQGQVSPAVRSPLGGGAVRLSLAERCREGLLLLLLLEHHPAKRRQETNFPPVDLWVEIVPLALLLRARRLICFRGKEEAAVSVLSHRPPHTAEAPRREGPGQRGRSHKSELSAVTDGW